MEIEQLKLILESVNNTVGDAKTVAVTWLAVEGVKVILGYIMGGAVLFTAYKVALKIINAFTENSLARRLRDIAFPDQAYGNVSSLEEKRLMEIVRKHSEKKSPA